MAGGFSADELRKRSGGSGCEENSIAEVSGGDPAVGLRAWADERELVNRSKGGAGAESGPAFEDFGVGDGRPEFRGGFEESGDGVGFDGLVEPSMLDGCADGDTGIASGYEVDFRSAEDVGEGLRAAHADGGHLALCGRDMGMAGGETAECGGLGPCSCAVDEVSGGDCGGCGLDDDAGGFGIY